MLSQAVGYAALSLGFLAGRPDGTALVREIAAACEIPAPYLSKIVNQLSRAGLVKTQRGVGGGARLSREAPLISLYDLCEVLNDPAIQSRCMLGVADCSDQRGCPAHEFNSARRERLIEYLKSMSIADIAEFQRTRQDSPLTILSKGQVTVDGECGSN
ncbi:MAG: Rrf2 family transcriptional regulator [Phycisphaerales bacterium]